MVMYMSTYRLIIFEYSPGAFSSRKIWAPGHARQRRAEDAGNVLRLELVDEIRAGLQRQAGELAQGAVATGEHISVGVRVALYDQTLQARTFQVYVQVCCGKRAFCWCRRFVDS